MLTHSCLKYRTALLSLLLLVAMVASGCSNTPGGAAKTQSYKLSERACGDWILSETDDRQRAADHSGHALLNTGREAFVSRVALLQSAEQTFDAQYYIWNNDKTGRVLAHRVVVAADRGVRVRLLVDDYGIGGKDNQLASLDAHEDIEVRVYNPFNAGYRSGLRKWGSFAFGFQRLNRRMHSKTFIVDNCAVVTGGRNIGDEYFDAGEELNHRDRDILSLGPVVDDISGQFDKMWNSEFAIPIHALISSPISDNDR